ncbi:hypothetical protein ABD440_04755 [Chromobacterium piscinae]
MFGSMQVDARIGRGLIAACLAGLILWAGAIPAARADESASAPVAAQAAASGSPSADKPPGGIAAGPHQAAVDAGKEKTAGLPQWLTITLLAGVTLFWLTALIGVVRGLRAGGWRLSHALMEEAALPEGTPPPAAGAMPPMAPSVSRLIAMVGTIVLGSFFLAIGYYVLWQLCNGQSIEAAQGTWSYFAGGATLFLPYGVNKLSSVFK